MKIYCKNNLYFIVDHKYEKISLLYTIKNLKDQLKCNELYPLLIDDKNEVDCLFAKLKLKRIQKNKIIVNIVFFNTKYDSIFKEVTKDIGFAINPIGNSKELFALGITPYPSELDLTK